LEPWNRSFSTLKAATLPSALATRWVSVWISVSSHTDASSVSETSSSARRVTCALATALAIRAASSGSTERTWTVMMAESRSWMTVMRSSRLLSTVSSTFWGEGVRPSRR
jgi:hypothetical protein